MAGKIPIPVTVLTGFLGAGKTTILRHLAGSGGLARTLVLINEFGEFGLDHHLLAHLDDDSVVVMDSGCICCSIRYDLARTLSEAAWRYASGGERWFDRVVIETTGLADPVPVLQTLLGEPRVTRHYALGNVVTVVDSVCGEATLEAHAEARRQVAVADCLLLTKTDLRESCRPEGLYNRLRALSALPPVIVQKGAVAEDLLFSEEKGLLSRSRSHQGAVHAEHFRTTDALPHTHDSVDIAHAGISAVSLYIESPVDAAVLDECLAGLLQQYGEELLRVKGLVFARNFERPLLVQAVRHVASVGEPLPEWPARLQRRTQLVVIARREWLSQRVLHDWFSSYGFQIHITTS